MEERPNYYAIIPASVRYDTELKPNEKLLYGEITSLMNKEGYCYASNKYFAELYNVSVQSISYWISNLINKGYLQSEIVYKENSKEISYRKLTTTLLKKSLIPIKENFKGGIKENFKDNNKDIIINNNIERYIERIQEFKPVLNSADYELIKQISNKYSLEELKQAIKVCKDNNAYSIKYLLQVLTNKPKTNKPEWLDKELSNDPIPEEDVKELLGGWEF